MAVAVSVVVAVFVVSAAVDVAVTIAVVCFHRSSKWNLIFGVGTTSYFLRLSIRMTV